ncbi:uncharacterized protein [Antedon mediterranea]|uniref:uncharacterized protein n=1 Tax=Antedon mediterranea TaxID=105859 RepID=UPI003AF47FEA
MAVIDLKLLLIVAGILMCSVVEGKSKNDVIDNVEFGGKLGCNKVKCSSNLVCPYGAILDKNGCPTCNCNDLPSTYRVNYACPLPMCGEFCPYGRKVKTNGCETCDCMPGNKP